jgi:hypothetical protein
LYWKRKKGKPMGVAQDVLLTTWFCLWKYIPRNHGAFVLLSICR